MKLRIRYLPVLLALVVSVSAYGSGVTKVGTTAAGFLNIDVGAKAVGMGGAYVAVSEDAGSMYWNPSGVARLGGAEAFFCNTRWIADVQFNYAGFAVPLGNLGTVGANAAFLSMDDMERTTIDYPDGTGETFGAGSYAMGLCYARNLTDRFSIGFNLKYINESIYHCSSQGMALDVGTLFDTNFSGLKIGMSISNFGTKMKMDGRDLLVQKDIDELVSGNNSAINAVLKTDEYDLPLMFRVGVSMDVLKGMGNSHLILAVDALHPNNDVEYVNVGCEYRFGNLFSLRGGYRSLFAQDAEAGVTFGGGVSTRIAGLPMVRIDYGYMDFGILKNVQMFTLGLSL